MKQQMFLYRRPTHIVISNSPTSEDYVVLIKLTKYPTITQSTLRCKLEPIILVCTYSESTCALLSFLFILMKLQKCKNEAVFVFYALYFVAFTVFMSTSVLHLSAGYGLGCEVLEYFHFFVLLSTFSWCAAHVNPKQHSETWWGCFSLTSSVDSS